MAKKIFLVRVSQLDWNVIQSLGIDGICQLKKISSFEFVKDTLGRPDGVLWRFDSNKSNREILFSAIRSIQFMVCRLYQQDRFSDYLILDLLCSKLLRCLL